MSGSFFQPQLSGRWKKLTGAPHADALRPVVVPVEAKWSLSQLTTYRCGVEEEFAIAAAAGFRGVGLWRTKLITEEDAAVAGSLQRHGLKATSLSWAGGFTGSLGFSYEDALEDARDAVRQAARLQAETLIVLTGSQNGHIVSYSRKTARDALLLLADEAGDLGVKLAVLPTQARFDKNLTFLHTAEKTLDFLNYVNHSNVGMVFDTFHLWQTPNLLDHIPDLIAKTFVVQVSDSPVDPKDQLDRRLPGQGALPLPEILGQFLSFGYAGFFDIQVWSEQVWQMTPPEVVSACCQFEATVSSTTARFA